MISLPIRYTTTSDNVRIAYISVGDGPPVVFASNIFGDATAYRFAWPHVMEVTDRLVCLGWQVTRYDVRGMGSSDRDVEDLSLEGRVRDLASVVGQLDLARFVLVGLDIGAATAVAYAVRHPTAVSRLVLLSPWASGVRRLRIPELRAAYSAEAAGDRERSVFANILSSVATGFRDGDLSRQSTERLLHSTSPEGLSAFNAATASTSPICLGR